MNNLTLSAILLLSLFSFPYLTMAQANISYDKSGNRIKMAITIEQQPTTLLSNINERKEKSVQFEKFSVYPNPTSEVINIKCENSDVTYDVKIYDINGKLIIEKTCHNESSIDLKNLNDGVYILNIFNDNHSKHWKILKQ
jgi:hypothetical protein